MSVINFNLLTNQYGERYIHYKNSSAEKLIEDFSKIPFSAESLFEDICDGFSGFLCKNEQINDFSTDYEYNIANELVGINVPSFRLGEEKIFKIQFTKIVNVIIDTDTIQAEFYILRMTESEKELFNKFQAHLKTHCNNNNLSLHICNKEIYFSINNY